MEGLAQIVEPPVCVHHNRLRSLEGLLRLQLPVKAVRVDAHENSRRVVGADLRLGQEIPAVHKAESIGFPLEFIRLRAL